MIRVLVVDDSPTQVEEIRIVLQTRGFAVESTSDGRAGLEAYERSGFDVVVSDVRLPGLSGFDLCRALKAKGTDVPVILMTTLRNPGEIVDGLACGADVFLPKPIDAIALPDRIETLLKTTNTPSGENGCQEIPLVFMGRKFSVSPRRGQVLDLLLSALGEIDRRNRELEESQRALLAAKAELEDRSRQERLLLGSAIDQIAESVFITNLDGNIVYVNPAFERITGYSRAEVLGQSPRLMRSGQHPESVYDDLWATIRRGEHYTGRIVNRRKDGTLWDAESGASPVRNAAGTITHFVSVQQDVTHQRQLEEMLSQAQKMEALGQLTGGIAHDFNNLLTVIMGYCELAVEDLAPGDPLRETLEPVVAAARRASALTRQLLTFSRKQVISPVALDLDTAIAGMGGMLRRVIGEDIELRLAPGSAPTRVKVDPIHVEQVVLNLVVNARDAMPRGGRLSIETSKVRLDAGDSALMPSAPPGDYVCLAVSDTGTGMEPETLAHIFEPFFTTKPKGKGTGLGLATVYGIVEQAGGTIRVASTPGKGTTFSIHLPALALTTAQAGSSEVETPQSRGTETVLLVEDEEPVRQLARIVLERAGYSVIATSNAGEALLAFEQSPGTIDLVLTDVVMPRLSGPELVARLIARRSDLKVLYMSGHLDRAGEGLDARTIEQDCLAKPFAPAVLVRKVRAALDRAKA